MKQKLKKNKFNNPNKINLEKASDRIRGMVSTQTTRRNTMNTLPTENNLLTYHSHLKTLQDDPLEDLPQTTQIKPQQSIEQVSKNYEYEHSIKRKQRLKVLTNFDDLKKKQITKNSDLNREKFKNTKTEQSEKIKISLQSHMDKFYEKQTDQNTKSSCFQSYRSNFFNNYVKIDKNANQNMYNVKTDTVNKKITQNINIKKYSERKFDYIKKKNDYIQINPNKQKQNEAGYYLDMKKQVKKQDFFKQWLMTDKEVYDQNLGVKDDDSKKYFKQIQTFYDLYVDQGRRIYTNPDQFLNKFQPKNYEKNKHQTDLFDIFSEKPQVLETQHMYIIQQDREFGKQERQKIQTQQKLQYKLKKNQTQMSQTQCNELPNTQFMNNWLSKHQKLKKQQ